MQKPDLIVAVCLGFISSAAVGGGLTALYLRVSPASSLGITIMGIFGLVGSLAFFLSVLFKD